MVEGSASERNLDESWGGGNRSAVGAGAFRNVCGEFPVGSADGTVRQWVSWERGRDCSTMVRGQVSDSRRKLSAPFGRQSRQSV